MTSKSKVVEISRRNSLLEDPFFQKHHRDFQNMRLQMLKESKEFWSKVDHNGVDRNRSTSVDFGSSAQPLCPTTMVARQLDSNNFPQWVLPHLPPRRCFFSKNSILSIMEDDDCFEVALDVSSYKPEELQVSTTDDNLIIIEGNHYHTDANETDSTRNSTMTSQFYQQLTLPPACKSMKVESNLSRDGVLFVSVSKKTQ